MENSQKVMAVQRMQSFINTNITQPITLNMLARAAGYSPWYSSRIFKELLGKSPFEYIRSLRLSKAALNLRDNEARIIDVALDYVFDSHEGFTRAFSKEFGITPKVYSKQRPPIKLFMPMPIRDYYLTLIKGEEVMSEKAKPNSIFVQVIDKPERKVILKRGKRATHYFEYCDEVGCDVWGILTSVKEAINEPVGMWLPEGMRKPGTSMYVQGVEVPHNYEGQVPEGFELMDLPSCKMMIFQGQPFEDEKFGDAIGDLMEIMKNYDPQIYGFQWADEDGPRFQMEPVGYRGYIEGRPVRLIK